MEQYIPKSVLVAEIDRQKIGYNVDGKHSVEYNTTRKILNILDTLEVKEVDLNEEIEKCLKKHSMLAVGKKDFTDIAKHFFELGLQSTQKEEPKKCMYSKDDYTDEDRKVLCDGCDAECIEKVKEERKRDLSLWSLGDFENNFFEIIKPYKDSHNYKNLCTRLAVWRSELWRWIDWKKRKEEPVSEDLDMEITEEYRHFHNIDMLTFEEIARHFADWQKQQDMQKFQNNETATFTREEFDEEIEKAKEEARQQIMKDAVEGEVVKDITNNLYINSKAQVNKNNFKFGEKVQILVLKEE